MARQTRSERRALRAAQAESQAAVERTRVRPQQMRPVPEPVASQDEGRRPPGWFIKRFISESWGELQKVEWPTRPQVIQGTVVVLLACLIVGVYLFAADEVFKRLVQHVLLR
jgi:preprotein translocase subunit SecE